MAETITLPPVLERYELKYLIPWDLVEPITDYLSIYCDMDAFSKKFAHENYFYQVGSLYFDSPNNEFFQQRMLGKQERINMRCRFYGDGYQGPYHLEIKHRTGISGVVTKYRATANEAQWPNIISDPSFRIPDDESAGERTSKERFMRLATSYAIEPKILTTYKRRAFFSTIDEYSRVTMDAHMKYRIQDHYNLKHDFDMTHYDNETVYAMDDKHDASVVLELKCMVGEVPYWILDLIRRFDLKQMGFSKYANSRMVGYYDNGDWYMDNDRKSVFENQIIY